MDDLTWCLTVHVRVLGLASAVRSALFLFSGSLLDRWPVTNKLFLLLQAAAHAAHQAAASAPPAACAKGRSATLAAVSEEPATSALYCPCDGACVNN